MKAKWDGLPLQEVYADWANALGGCSLGAVNYAITQSKLEEFPPSQGKFLDLCKQYRPNNLIALSRKFSAEDVEKNKKRIQEITDILKNKLTKEN